MRPSSAAAPGAAKLAGTKRGRDSNVREIQVNGETVLEIPDSDDDGTCGGGGGGGGGGSGSSGGGGDMAAVAAEE